MFSLGAVSSKTFTFFLVLQIPHNWSFVRKGFSRIATHTFHGNVSSLLSRVLIIVIVIFFVIIQINCNYLFLATLVALHFTPVSQ